MDTQINIQDLKEKIASYLEELARETDQARQSEAMQKYLMFAARFHQYSSCNIMLILLSKPDATNVAGFQTWKKMGRYVKKGEKGIPIFAPLIHKEEADKDDSPKALIGFRIVYVFDVSQTDGNPLPPVPDWKSPEKNDELNERLIAFAKSKGIEVVYKDLPGEIQGISRGGLIELDSSVGVKTLIHEIAHELMHRGEEGPKERSQRELEAEAVAYSVSKYFGIEKLNSLNYLGLFGISTENFIQSTNRIFETTSEIVQFIDVTGEIE